MRNNAAIKHSIKSLPRKTRTMLVRKNVPLPTLDIGYYQRQMFSQFRNGYSCIYRALHTLNLTHGPATFRDIEKVLASSPKCGGYAFFIKASTIRTYLHKNAYGLWRKLDRKRAGNKGAPMALYVANGLTIGGKIRAPRNKKRIPVQMTWVW